MNNINKPDNYGEYEERAASHQQLLQQIHRMYRAKNRDYGSSFSTLYDTYGLISPIIKLEDKLSRLRNLAKSDEICVKDESIEDTLLDLANYAIMTVLEMRREKESFNSEDFDYDSLPKIVAVDFDGTLAQGATFPEIGELNVELYEELVSGRYSDYQKILWTNRTGRSLQNALDWLKKNAPDLHFDAVNDNVPDVVNTIGGPYPKLWCNLFIDDRSVNPSIAEDKNSKL